MSEDVCLSRIFGFSHFLMFTERLKKSRSGQITDESKHCVSEATQVRHCVPRIVTGWGP